MGLAYSDLLKDPQWQRKRLEVFQKDNFRCVYCDDDKLTLHGHHPKYIHGRAPWEYETIELITLCEDCHEVEHLPLTRLERFMLLVLRTRHVGETVNIKMLNEYIHKYHQRQV